MFFLFCQPVKHLPLQSYGSSSSMSASPAVEDSDGASPFSSSAANPVHVPASLFGMGFRAFNDAMLTTHVESPEEDVNPSMSAHTTTVEAAAAVTFVKSSHASAFTAPSSSLLASPRAFE